MIEFSDLLFSVSIYLQCAAFGAAIDPICYVTISRAEMQRLNARKNGRGTHIHRTGRHKITAPFVDFSAKI